MLLGLRRTTSIRHGILQRRYHFVIMKILFCDVSAWEIPYINDLKRDHEVIIYEESLTVEIGKKHSDADIISTFIYSELGAQELESFPTLKAICTRSTGFDHIDLDYCRRRSVAVYNVPFYGENTVAEHTFALILSLSRNVHRSYMRTRAGNFGIDGLIGFDLKGKTIGVIGAGHIGQHVIRIAKGFGMNVLAFDTQKDLFLSEVLGFTYTDIPTVLKESDIITLHVPYNTHTHHMIDQKAIETMKDGALLINTARGGVVDTTALLHALDSGKLSGAGLDVIEGEEDILEEKHVRGEDHAEEREVLTRDLNIISKENVVYTPHIAFYSKEAVERIICTTLENITSFVRGEKENSIGA